MTDKTNTIPAFDEMSEPDLRAFWAKYHRPNRAEAQALVGEGFTPREAVKIAEVLACYAINKACAVGLRLEGKVNQAMTYEEACELNYRQLPENLRW